MRGDIILQAETIRADMDKAGGMLTDEQAAAVPLLYPVWAVGMEVAPGERFYYPPTYKLYKVLQAHTTQADWTPDLTPALYAVVDAGHAGTLEDPIEAARGMEYTYSLYYLDPEDGKTYLCQRGAETGTIVLHYLPHELVGQYFEEA